MIENDPADGYRYPFDRSIDPSQATYLVVAETLDCRPMELPQLGRTIDTDSLDALFDTRKSSQNATISFEYAGCAVMVTPSEIRVDVQ